MFIVRSRAYVEHDTDVAIPSVRLSVCPSVTRWYCVKTAELIVIQSTLRGNLETLVF